MATIRIPNIDEEGRFLNPEVQARLDERYDHASTGGNITPATTLDEAAASGAQ